MSINEKGLSLIKHFEGCKLTAYKDIVGVWTCGWGSTGPDIMGGTVWTPWQAEDRLKQDLKKFEDGITKAVRTKLTENQFSALVCFAYNVGLGAFGTSKMCRYLNDNDHLLASKEFERWNKAGGVPVLGLTRRRKAEKELFLL